MSELFPPLPPPRPEQPPGLGWVRFEGFDEIWKVELPEPPEASRESDGRSPRSIRFLSVFQRLLLAGRM